MPALAGLTPNSANAGAAAFTLTVNGTGFVSGATVRWNGNNRQTTVVSATQLTAQIPASDLLTLGPATVTVFNPSSSAGGGGGTSTAQSFNVLANVANLSAASFSGAELAADAIVAAFGSELATQTLAAPVTPLPTTLAGTTVRVRDSAGVERPAPLFFVAPTQINYLMPAGPAAGAATVTIDHQRQRQTRARRGADCGGRAGPFRRQCQRARRGGGGGFAGARRGANLRSRRAV